MDSFKYYQRHYPVMWGYIKREFLKTKTEADTLHSFFSPNLVPAGLIKEEIGVCLKLSKIRSEQKSKHSKTYNPKIMLADLQQLTLIRDLMYDPFTEMMEMTEHDIIKKAKEIEAEMPPVPDIAIDLPVLFPPSLPRELLQSPMTRESFQIGVSKFIEDAFRKARS